MAWHRNRSNPADRHTDSGKGSEFTVRLPAPHEQVETAERPILPIGKRPGRRVLVVVDNVDAADCLGRLLPRLRDHETRAAYDGPSAPTPARSSRPRSSCSRSGCRDIDGCKVDRRSRADPQLARALLIAVIE
jgi:hypothetical protein